MCSTDFRLVLFIDSLDEFDGCNEVDHENLVKLLKTISKSPNIKICVSSRPWLMFEELFKNCPGLRLQDLTRDDIRLYVSDRFQADSKMQLLVRLEPEHASTLAEQIQQKANGVFLWVRLVVKSLLEGLRNGDDISDLQRRLSYLPNDLNALYSHMLSRIDFFYATQYSQIFEIYNAATDLDIKPTVLELELAITANFTAATAEVDEAMEKYEIESRFQRMMARLKSRCGGLLEVHDIMDRSWESLDRKNTDDQEEVEESTNQVEHSHVQTESQRLRTDWTVSYLHRTVKDYLKKDAVRAELHSHASRGTDFDANFSLLMSYVIGLKRSVASFHCKKRTNKRVWAMIRDALMCTSKVEQSRVPLRKTLLSKIMLYTCQNWETTLESTKAKQWRAEFLAMATCCGLASFVDHELHSQNDKALPYSMSGLPILTYALGPYRLFKHTKFPNDIIQPSMVEVLLKHGADPNEVTILASITGYSMWQHVLHSPYDQISAITRDSQSHLMIMARVFKAMLRHGAAIEEPCKRIDGGPSISSSCLIEFFADSVSEAIYKHRHPVKHRTVWTIIDDLFGKFLPGEALNLQAIIQERNQMKDISTPTYLNGSHGKKRHYEELLE